MHDAIHGSGKEHYTSGSHSPSKPRSAFDTTKLDMLRDDEYVLVETEA